MIDCELFLYADDTCLVYQPKDVREIEQDLKSTFPNDFYWFIDNRQSIHVGYEKSKSILFGIKYKVNKVGSLDIRYALVIARLRVQYGQYFPRFSYFADLFHEPLGE